jgi:hypothetical protein
LRSFSCNDESVWTPGENVARSIEFSSTCWLIKRGSQWLLWDTGVPESALNDPKGWSTLPKLIVYHLDKALTDQLAEIGLNTSDITYVALRSLGLEPLFSPFAVSIVIDELLDRVRATRRQIRAHRPDCSDLRRDVIAAVEPNRRTHRHYLPRYAVTNSERANSDQPPRSTCLTTRPSDIT